MITENTIIGDLVAENYAFADIFYARGIDFCCGGNCSIAEASAEKGYNEQEKANLLRELENLKTTNPGADSEINTWPIDLLADYIEKKHHRFIEREVPVLKELLKKIAHVHGDEHPELIKIEELFQEAVDDLIPHLKKEELLLFPRIRRWATNPDEFEISKTELDELLDRLNDEHTHEGDLFKAIARLSNQYTVPNDACNTYRVAFGKLKEFETDLFRHIHLENNILFKRFATAMQNLM